MARLFSLLGLLACLGCAGGAGSKPAQPTMVAAHEQLPDLVVASLDQQPVRLREVVRGKVAVIDLWATWCKACREVSAQAEALARAHPNGEVVVIGVDEGEEREVVAAWLEGRPPAYPIYVDPKLAVSDRLGVTELPTVIVVDREGYIRRVAGQIDAEVLRLVDELVKKPQQSSAIRAP